MSKEIATTAFSAMQTDIQVSMDDVVSAFVSQYENNLYARKKELSADIKEVEAELEKFLKDLQKKINGKSFVKPLPLDLVATVSEGSFDWTKAKVAFTVEVALKKNHLRTHYSSTIKISKEKPIPAAQVKAYKKLADELSALRADLNEILVSLKSVARKERQVRGRIAIRKLEDSGYANLMNDDELIKLVQLED